MALIKVIMLLFLAGIIMALEVITTSAKQSSIPSEQSKLDDWIDHNMRAYEKDKTDLSETINNKLTLDKALTAAEHAVRVVKVSQDGKGDFNTITDAVNSIPSGNTGRVVVWISGGVYCEHIMIDRTKPFVTLYGDEDNVPVITSSLYIIMVQNMVLVMLKKAKKVKHREIEEASAVNNGEAGVCSDPHSARLSGTKHGVGDAKDELKVPSMVGTNGKAAKAASNGTVSVKSSSNNAAAKRFKATDIAPAHATKEVYASIFTSSRKSEFKETYSCRSLPLGRN
ncbi:hypothetical protein F8388_023670 [Cannabis sativa]|uniref:pectinesterase n=2 Tax=Cannabis sativa TaxID=3483 RepID=A0A7J6G9L6_CANSA|nr:hypothetical protein F8388_023670 [Cannabis sativa]